MQSNKQGSTYRRNIVGGNNTNVTDDFTIFPTVGQFYNSFCSPKYRDKSARTAFNSPKSRFSPSSSMGEINSLYSTGLRVAFANILSMLVLSTYP